MSDFSKEISFRPFLGLKPFGIRFPRILIPQILSNFIHTLRCTKKVIFDLLKSNLKAIFLPFLLLRGKATQYKKAEKEQYE